MAGLGHLGINVADLTAAKAYYDRLLPALGYEPFFARDDEFSYRPADGRPGTYLFFYPALEGGDVSRHRVGLQHLAFRCSTRSQVRRVREVAAELGSTIVHEPREWPEYPPPYFACFWTDLHGILLEAVCHHDRD